MAAGRAVQEVVLTLRPQSSEHRGGINALALAAGGGLLYSAGRDGVCHVWDVATPGADPTHVASLVGHSDWVNDVVSGNDLVITCSNDQTVLLWGGATRNHERLGTLTGHADYVKAIAYSAATHCLATCSLDQSILLWDLQAAQPAARKRPSRPVRMVGPSDSSYYDIALDAAGRLVASASTDGIVHIWDSRSAAHVCRLQGHEAPVRCVQMDRDGTVVVSGSSDNTLRVWDVGQQRCVHTCEPHSDSVWAMAPWGDSGAAGFCEMLSAGRDGSVCSTNVRSGTSCTVLPASAVLGVHSDAAAASADRSSSSEAAAGPGTGRLHAPLSLVVSESGIGSHNESVWVATTTSDLNEYALAKREGGCGSGAADGDGDGEGGGRGSGGISVPLPAAPPDSVCPRPERRIAGLPGIIRHAVLNNRRHVLTQDDTGLLELWDVTRGRQLESLGRVPFRDFDAHAAELSAKEKVQVPSWFTAETKLGSLAIHLKAPQCFESVVYACDAGLTHDGTDGRQDAVDLTSEVKLNLGSHMLRSLFVAATQTQPRAPAPPISVPLPAESDDQDQDQDQEQDQERDRENTDMHSSGSAGARDGRSEGGDDEDHGHADAETRSSKESAQERQGSATGVDAEKTEAGEEKHEETVDRSQKSSTAREITDNSTQLQLYPLPADLPLLITEQRERGGSPRVKFRTTLGSISPADQQILPAWVFDTVVRGRELSRELPKLNFLLQPHPSVSTKSLLGQMEAQKLSAPRLLRVRKIMDHVESKLREAEEAAGSSRGKDSEPTKIEVVCNDVVLPPGTNLGKCAAQRRPVLRLRLSCPRAGCRIIRPSYWIPLIAVLCTPPQAQHGRSTGKAIWILSSVSDP